MVSKEIMAAAKDLVIACDRVYNRKLQTGSGGNVSARIPGSDHMLVKASGGSMGDCLVDEEKGIMKGFVVCDFDGNLITGEVIYETENTKLAEGWDKEIKVILEAISRFDRELKGRSNA